MPLLCSYDLEAMSHLMSHGSNTAIDDLPPLLLVQKKELRPPRMRKARSHRRRRSGPDGSDAGSAVTSTTYQDLDGLLDDDELDDDGQWGAEEMERLNGFLQHLVVGEVPSGGDEMAPEGGERESGERESGERESGERESGER